MLRLYLEPKDLNRAIKRPRQCTPTLDDRSHIRPTGENTYIQNNIPGDQPLTVLNDVCSTIPSTSRENCEQTTLASDAPANNHKNQLQKLRSADPQDLSSPREID